MARAYPRFLYSNPKNTKSEGPFLIHCLHPIIIFKVKIDDVLTATLLPLNLESDFDGEQLRKIVSDGLRWIAEQWRLGEISL